MSALTESPAWAALAEHQRTLAGGHLREWFAAEPDRAARHSLEGAGVFADFSKHRVDDRALALLHALAVQQDVAGWRDRMFAGDAVNTAEERSALHTALRRPASAPLVVDGTDVMPGVAEVLARMRQFCAAVRDGGRRGHTGQRFTDVVNLGIGGSDLGPAMVTEALQPFTSDALRVHYVSNVDAADLAPRLAGLDPATTLFIICSKTFTTIETITNADTARQWLVAGLGDPRATGAHFVAVSTNLEGTRQFGIDPGNVFGFWDWVGGRFSLWSAVGMAVMLAIGPEAFDELLAGARAMDEHFLQAPAERNLPIRMGLLGVWYGNFFGARTHAVLPYDQRLHRLPAHLQQLEMESNGKSVDRQGRRIDHATCPVIWGSPGTNGQHAFYQLLHQGTQLIPADFIVARQPHHAHPLHHRLLVANCLAQSEALAFGKTTDEARAELAARGISGVLLDLLAANQTFAGNQPTTTLVVERLDPHAVGALVALYEHKVLVQSALWNINPFDQWGVELGKKLALRIGTCLVPGAAQALGLDGSTRALIERLRT
ncbi:MAG: glucose-6-phosphate isomerase [Betaproteobacteria bacterium]|jgi:glucose-6-phosphate isomerase|nr:glucose-6-phosphate isomerase [Betaproteobacteria bacterium]